MSMSRENFYASLRRRESGVFGTSLSQEQVRGTEAILDACIRYGVSDAHHVANILGQIYHETGGRMAPVRETFATTDQSAINRLENAWKAEQLSWVRTPYWRADADGKSWLGRGFIQLTHKHNYQKMGARLGVNLVGDPSLAMDTKVSADIAVVGMMEGLFTGRKLPDFNFPNALTAPVSANPRRIVNGQDGTDAKVAGYHRAFHAAIVAGGGWSAPKPSPAPSQPSQPETPSADADEGTAGKVFAFAIFAAIAGAFLYFAT